MSGETKKGIIEGLKKAIEAYQGADLLDAGITYQVLIHDPDILYSFIQTYRANKGVIDQIVVGKDGAAVTKEDAPLVCGVSLAQVQQLLVRTCARYFLEQATKEDEAEIVTETRTTTRFLIFKKTEQIERKVGGGFDERKVRELARSVAFDWQLPLLASYAELSTVHVMELEANILALRTPETVRTVAAFEPSVLRKAKEVTQSDFLAMLEAKPSAIGGVGQWSPDLYKFYRATLGDRAWEFFGRDKSFFMVCASLDKPVARIFGDVLCYIAPENLEEMQRLNIDKADVLITAMKNAFGERTPLVLAQPNFARDILRKLVESMLHITQEKDQLLVSANLTCKAIAGQVNDWLHKQPPLSA